MSTAYVTRHYLPYLADNKAWLIQIFVWHLNRARIGKNVDKNDHLMIVVIFYHNKDSTVNFAPG